MNATETGPREFMLSTYASGRLKAISMAQGGLVVSGIGALIAGGLTVGRGLGVEGASVGFVGAILLVPAALFVAGASLGSRKRSWRAGMRGENRVREVLRAHLGPEHAVFYNIPTGKGDIDCVIVGPDGMFALEIKDHHGLISYSAAAGWSQLKFGREGTPYRGGLKNPSGQLLAGIRWLKDVLKKAGVEVWINGAVVFTNPAADLCPIQGLRGVSAVKVENLTAFLRRGKPLASAVRESIEARLLAKTDGRETKGSNTDTAPQNGAHAFSRWPHRVPQHIVEENHEVSIP